MKIKISPIERLYNGIIKENPTFILMLGMCPTLAVTTLAINGIGMGFSTTIILVISNLFVSLLRKIIPKKIRVPIYIIIIASLVTIIEFLLEGFFPQLYDALGIYIPLIVVNCIVLGRAESFASKNNIVNSIFDGIGMGFGFTISITILATLREILGFGTIFNHKIMPNFYKPITIFALSPGAFFVLSFIVALFNVIIKNNNNKNQCNLTKHNKIFLNICLLCNNKLCNNNKK